MSCCEKYDICVAGKTYRASINVNPRGVFISGSYLDNNLTLQNLVAGSFEFGVCPLAAAPVINNFRSVQALVAGNNVIAHGLQGIFPIVDVRNNATGATVAHRVVAESLGSVTINLAVGVAAARITVDV